MIRNPHKNHSGQLINGIGLILFGLFFVLMTEWIYYGSNPAYQLTETVSNGVYKERIPMTPARRLQLEEVRRTNRALFDCAGGIILIFGIAAVIRTLKTHHLNGFGKKKISARLYSSTFAFLKPWDTELNQSWQPTEPTYYPVYL